MRSEDWYRHHCNAPLLTAEQETQLGRQIQAWLQHPDGPDGAPPVVIRRGRRARDRMVQSNVRLVFSVAGRFRISDRDRDDLIQEGIIGLQRAAEKFDPARGYKFSTYAYWWIRQGIQRHQANCRVIKLPTDYGDMLRAVAQCRDRLTLQNGRSPSLAEIGADLNLTPDDIRVLSTTAADCVSLSQTPRGVAGDDCTIEAAIADDRMLPDELLCQDEMREVIDCALAGFEPWQRDVIDAAWGLNGVKKRSIAQLARATGQKQPRIRGVLTMAKHYLRFHLRPLARDDMPPTAGVSRPPVPSVESPYITVQPVLPLVAA